MSDDVTLIVSISLIIIFSPFLAKVFNIPTTPIEIIFGSLLGYIGFIHHSELLDFVAEIGFLYLMFIAGTEIDIKKVLSTPASMMRRIFLYLALLYLFAIVFSYYLNQGKMFMVLLPLISVGLVATLSKEYGKTPWVNLSMTAGGIGEVVSIAVLTLASAALQHGMGYEFIKIIGALLLFIVIILLIFRALQLLFWWFPEVSLALMPHEDNKEQDVRLSMGIFFLLIGAMLYLDLELAFGAFIAGMFIPTFFDHKHELPEKLASYGFGVLVPIFFVHIGSSFSLEALLIPGLVLAALYIAFGMIAMRVLSALVFAKSFGYRNAILMGLSHSMPLTLLIAVATLAYHANSIDKFHYFAFILASLFQVIIVMIGIKAIQKKKVEEVV